MTKPDLTERLSTPSTISRYAVAVLSVAVAIAAAELIMRLLNTEAIALRSHFRRMGRRAWPGIAGGHVRSPAFHYYLVSASRFPGNTIFRCECFGDAAPNPVFHYISRGCIPDLVAEEGNSRTSAFEL